MKRTMWTRLTALLCGMMVLLALCAGCNDSKQPDVSGGDNTNVSQGSSTEGISLKSALKYAVNENLDLQNKKLTISVWGGVSEENQGNDYIDRRYALERRTEERYHVDIEWMPTNTATFIQDVTLAFSSGKKYADLMFAPSYYGFDLCRVGAVLPLDDYIDYSNPYYAMTGDNLLYVDGKHYSYFPDEVRSNNLGYFLIYNQTLLEKAGCADPMTLYQEGKWDWDALKDMIKKCTIIENGEAVQYGIGGSNLLDALCLSNGFSMINMNTTTHKFECSLYTDAGLNVLNYLREIGYTMKGTDQNYGGHNSKITFGDSKTVFLVSPSYYPGTYVVSGMPVGSVPMPKGPDAKKYTVGLEMQEWWLVSAISDFDIHDLLQVALDMNDNDAAYPDTYIAPEDVKENFVTETYEGCVFTTEDEAEFFYDYITSGKQDTIMNITCVDLGSTFATNIFYPIIDGKDPRTVLESVKPVINTAMTNMLPDRLK